MSTHIFIFTDNTSGPGNSGYILLVTNKIDTRLKNIYITSLRVKIIRLIGLLKNSNSSLFFVLFILVMFLLLYFWRGVGVCENNDPYQNFVGTDEKIAYCSHNKYAMVTKKFF